MAEPTQPTPDEIAAWDAHYGVAHRLVSIGGPEEGDDVTPCPALIADTPDGHRVHVCVQLDEIEVAQLATGGRLWLTCWGGLPVHSHLVIGGRQWPESMEVPDVQ